MRRLIQTIIVLVGFAPAIARAHDDQPTGGAAAATAVPAVTASETPPSVEKWAARFKGSILILDQSITPDVIAPNVQLSPIPSYQWWISFRPRYYFTPDLSLRLRMDLTVEWLNAEETTLYREPQFGDIWTDVVYGGIPKLLGIDTSVGLRLVFPTSKLSQTRTNILNLSATLGFNRTFETRIGSFDIGLIGGLGHTFTRADRPGLINGNSYDCQSPDGAHTVCYSDTGKMNALLGFNGGITAKYTLSRLSLGLTYIVLDSIAYDVPGACVTDPVTHTPACTDGSKTRGDQRLGEIGWFLASADVEATSWLSFSLGYYVKRNMLAPDGQYGNPFWSPGGDTRIFFSTNLALDAIYRSSATLAARRRAATAAPSTRTATAQNAISPF